jgi:hypothetical protein
MYAYKEVYSMSAFWLEVYNEAVEFIFLVVVALAGIFAGIALRKNKNKKEAAAQTEA